MDKWSAVAKERIDLAKALIRAAEKSQDPKKAKGPKKGAKGSAEAEAASSATGGK